MKKHKLDLHLIKSANHTWMALRHLKLGLSKLALAHEEMGKSERFGHSPVEASYKTIAKDYNGLLSYYVKELEYDR